MSQSVSCLQSNKHFLQHSSKSIYFQLKPKLIEILSFIVASHYSIPEQKDQINRMNRYLCGPKNSFDSTLQ